MKKKRTYYQSMSKAKRLRRKRNAVKIFSGYLSDISKRKGFFTGLFELSQEEWP